MAGIDSIIERILTEARESADARVARAESDAEKLIAKKKDQAKEEEAKMLSEAQAVIDAQARQNRATQNTKSQRRLLSERVAMIDEIVEEAKKRIPRCPKTPDLLIPDASSSAGNASITGRWMRWLPTARKRSVTRSTGCFFQSKWKGTLKVHGCK